MPPKTPARSPDYLVIGHVAKDLTPRGPALGGTVAYSGLTARRLGLNVGIVTSAGPDLDLQPLLSQAEVVNLPAEQCTTFLNQYTSTGRVQTLLGRALSLDLSAVPPAWTSAPIVHLAPIAREVDAGMVRSFPDSMVGLTPQGWLRDWDAEGKVHRRAWAEEASTLPAAGVVILSEEDVEGDESAIDAMARCSRLLVVTQGYLGARVCWHGEWRQFPAPEVEQVDPTGCGDIFAACFLVRFSQTQDAWQAARFANALAAISITRPGLDAVPTPAEVQAAMA